MPTASIITIVGSALLRGSEDDAGDDDQAGNQPDQSCHDHVPHRPPRYAMSNRSVWTRSGGTPSPISAASVASIIRSGPQMKN
jgi:hypothetical protein